MEFLALFPVLGGSGHSTRCQACGEEATRRLLCVFVVHTRRQEGSAGPAEGHAGAQCQFAACSLLGALRDCPTCCIHWESQIKPRHRDHPAPGSADCTHVCTCAHMHPAHAYIWNLALPQSRLIEHCAPTLHGDSSSPLPTVHSHPTQPEPGWQVFTHRGAGSDTGRAMGRAGTPSAHPGSLKATSS